MHDQLQIDGFCILDNVFTATEVEDMVIEVNRALHQNHDGAALRTREGALYGARNLLQVWPAIADCWRKPILSNLMRRTLGPSFGLVRTLYFDKPPGQSWALPWHKDMTIAVRDNQLPSTHFSKPTKKAGVPHVEASVELLEQMLIARIHLDDVTDENGPLLVMPRSHESDTAPAPPVKILVQRGDVLLMRPLLDHCSYSSAPETTRHRRLLHLEFAGSPTLPDGFEWHDFIRGD